MAEVVGLIGGLYTIGKAGLGLYNTLTSFAEGIKTAERDVSLVAHEIKSTSEVLLLIRDSLEDSKDSRSEIVKKGRSILGSLGTQCEFCHALIRELISFLKPYFDESKCSTSKDLVLYGHRSRHLKLLDKWRWQQQRPKVDKLRGYLQGLKSNLSLLLPILHHEIAEEKRAPPVTLQSLKDTIETALRDTKSQPRRLAEELSQEADANRSTSMAVIPYRNRNVTPQDVVQDLAADILHADIQPREYSRYVGQLNTHDAARESPKDAYKRVSPYSTKDSIATSSDSDDSKKFSNTRAQTRSGQKARKYSSPIRYYLPSDQDVVDSRPNKSGFGCSLPKNMHSENPYEPWLHQRSDEKGGDEDNVPQWEKDEMKAFTVRALKAQRTFDEYDHYKYQRPTPTVLAEPEVFHNEREATTQFRKPPNIHRATYDDYEEAKAASDDQRQDWEDNRNTPRGRSDFQGVGVHVSPIPSCPRDSCLSYVDIKTWQMDVCKSIDPIEPEVFREHSSSYNEDLARYGVTSVWSNGKAGTEVESPSKVGAESTTRQNEQRNSWSFSWEALFGEEKSPKCLRHVTISTSLQERTAEPAR